MVLSGPCSGTGGRFGAPFDVHGRPMTDKIKALDFEPVEELGHMPQFIDRQRVTAFIKRIADRAFAAQR
jgi:hypothetical protein